MLELLSYLARVNDEAVAFLELVFIFFLNFFLAPRL